MKDSTILSQVDWKRYNRMHLFSELKLIRERLRNIAGLELSNDDNWIDKMSAQRQALSTIKISTALDNICTVFNLSNFERQLLLLCVAIQLDSTFPMLCAKAQGNEQCLYPTLSLAFSLFDNPSWDVLTPQSPLRYWRLIEFDANILLSSAPLKISEKILHYLLGNDFIEQKLSSVLQPLPAIDDATVTQTKIVQVIIDLWSNTGIENAQSLINLVGRDIDSKKSVAKTVCQKMELNLCCIRSDMLPNDIKLLEELSRLLERESMLNNIVYLFEYDIKNIDSKHQFSVLNVAQKLCVKCFILTEDNLPKNDYPIVNLSVNKPTKEEQQQIWQNAIEKFNPSNVNQQQIARLVGQFDLNAKQINNICQELWPTTIDKAKNDVSYQDIWQACRTALRVSVEDLVQVIEAKAQWEDLVLPKQQQQILEKILFHVTQRYQVYQNWGFAKKNTKGTGISVLFTGPSGTGKTLAAEVLANKLQLDLYYIDLSSVVNKYIGETEKNIKKIFDIAENSGAILLFDEADALFGRRSEVKDSHDRYANIETSYLLQRIESYSGLSILTTNIKDNIDNAFMRRIRFVVKFTYPEQNEREKIWKHILPKQVPQKNLAFDTLSQLNLSGGNIYNVALNAAFIAANEKDELAMRHLYLAAQDEYLKLDKTLPTITIDDEYSGQVE